MRRIFGPTRSPRNPRAIPPSEPGRQAFGWGVLVAGCTALAIAIMAASELLLWEVHGGTEDPWLGAFFVVRGIVMALLLASFTAWFVLRARRRIDAGQQLLRDRAEALRERERRIEHRLALDAASRIFAHEIRNRLNTILLSSTVLERSVASCPEPCRDRARHAAARLRQDVTALGELSRGYVSERSARLRHDVIDLEALACEVAAIHAPRIEDQGVVFEIAAAGARVVADADRLRQLLHHLVRNSLEAVEPGGRVRLECVREAGEVRIEVSDDGPGFAEVGRLFHPFYTTKDHGAGLGLAIVRDISELHGGRVEACNGPRGARVTVWLPAGEAMAAAA